jgi:hypothetical protein
VTASRRTLFRVLLALAVALAFYFSLAESDESRVEKVFERLAHAVHRPPDRSVLEWRRGLSAVFASDLTTSAQLSAPELGTVEGRERLLELALESGGVFEPELQASSIQVDERGASARLTMTLVSHLPGSEREERRVVTAKLVRDARSFRVQSLEIENALRDQPEARP